MRHLLSSMLLSLLMILTGIPALATPTTITYQGYLSTNSNAPVNTPVAMTVSLYADPTGGTALWSEHLPAVTVINGIFTVLIGSTTPINLTFNRVYYLGLAIGSDPELTPRQEMSSVPYAFRAATADKLGTVCSDGEGLRYTAFSSSWECAALSQWGTVTSVAVSGGTTGLTTSGGPVTTSGTLTLGGTLAVANGGTGATDGSITGTGVLSFTAGGSDTNIKLVPQGTGTVDVASKRITSLALPTTDSDAANKRYVDSSANVIRTGKTLSQIATLAWYTTMARTTYSVGRNPQGIAFDGTNMWVANTDDGTVTKLQASDGTVVGTYTVGSRPQSLAFDGTNIWVSNYLSSTVTKLLASDGTTVGTYSLGAGTNPQGLAFDGTNIWVASYGFNTVIKLLASDGTKVGTYNVGVQPQKIAFDGAYIWVSNTGSGTVTKLLASDGTTAGTYTLTSGAYPQDLAFDGTSIWVANYGLNSVSKLRAIDGTIAGTYNVGSHPQNIAFDGTHIWVSNYNGGTVTELLAINGDNLGTFPVAAPNGLAFDGTSIWVNSSGGRNYVTKLTPQ